MQQLQSDTPWSIKATTLYTFMMSCIALSEEITEGINLIPILEKGMIILEDSNLI